MIYKSLILTADDFGQSKIGNKNILKLAKLGKIQRVAIMVNGVINSEEVKKLLEANIKLDLHLTVGRISNKDLRFKNSLNRLIRFIFLYLFGKTKTRKVLLEWEEQIQKFQDIFSRLPDGLNSHEHIHFFPPYFKTTLVLCKKYKINFLRFGKKEVVPTSNLIGKILNFLNKINKKYFLDNEKNITSSDFLISLDWIENLDRVVGQDIIGTIEIVCHPERENEFRQLQNYPFL